MPSPTTPADRPFPVVVARRRRIRRLLPVAALLSLAGVVLLPGGVASPGPDCAEAAAQAGGTSVGLVIDFGTVPGSPGGLSRSCVSVAGGANGFQVLQAGGHAIRVDSSGLLCAIDGYPAGNQCGDRTGTGYRYWAYFHGTGGGWSYSSIGPGGYRVGSGSVEGWHFVEGRGNPSDPPPSASSAVASLCGSSPPPTAPPPTTPAPPPTARPTPTPTQPGGTGAPSGGNSGGATAAGSPGATGGTGSDSNQVGGSPGGVAPAGPDSAGPGSSPDGEPSTSGGGEGADAPGASTTSAPDSVATDLVGGDGEQPSGGADRPTEGAAADGAGAEQPAADRTDPPATDLVAASSLPTGGSPPWPAMALVVLVGAAAAWRFGSRRPG